MADSNRGSRTAFPLSPAVAGASPGPIIGLTVREYLAAAALQGLCANTQIDNRNRALVANMAVSLADALLEALRDEKTNSGNC
jgi:hypothetical protein